MAEEQEKQDKTGKSKLGKSFWIPSFWIPYIAGMVITLSSLFYIPLGAPSMPESIQRYNITKKVVSSIKTAREEAEKINDNQLVQLIDEQTRVLEQKNQKIKDIYSQEFRDYEDSRQRHAYISFASGIIGIGIALGSIAVNQTIRKRK